MLRIRSGRRVAVGSAVAGAIGLTLALVPLGSASAAGRNDVTGVPPGAIQHVIVIDLENQPFSATFAADSPATYLNGTLVPQGELLSQYYATGHVSLDNYLAQVSGQAPNGITSSDCSTATGGAYNDVVPGTLDADQTKYPGQVDGQGCVYPRTVQTIGNQLDATGRGHGQGNGVTWREYAEDMGNDVARDGGRPDPLGGTDCAHPTQTSGTATDNTNSAEGPNATGSTQVLSPVTDQYADRHNPFVYFHSVTDDAASCAEHVVPLGTATTSASGATHYTGHLAQDLARTSTTPEFAFISPNLCNDGHDGPCAGTNAAGTTTGGLAGADAFLHTWMPLILNSPAYRNGSTLVVITFDESGLMDATAGDNEQPGPGSANPGYSPLLNQPIAGLGGRTYYQALGDRNIVPGEEPPTGTMPGGGRVGALLLNPSWLRAGSVNTTSYNHYSALRTYEDLLGIRSGGTDGRGHLGFAATATAFGRDVFNGHPRGHGG